VKSTVAILDPVVLVLYGSMKVKVCRFGKPGNKAPAVTGNNRNNCYKGNGDTSEHLKLNVATPSGMHSNQKTSFRNFNSVVNL
jgi:hypothetical protein